MALFLRNLKRLNNYYGRHRSFSTQHEAILSPTHSRLTQNAFSWHKKHDKNYEGPLTASQIEEYYENGFVLIDDIIPQSLLDECKEGVNNMVDKLAKKLFSAGFITDICDNGNDVDNFKYRLINLEEQYPGASVCAHKIGHLEPSWLKLWEYPLFRDISFQLLQPVSTEIGAHPVWNLRCKVPENEEATVPWHQDVAYLLKSCWSTHQLTGWIPLLNTNTTNGCMEVITKSHQSGNVATHTACSGNTWYTDLNEDIIKKELFNDYSMNLNDHIVACEVKERSVLFLNNTVAHRSLQNYSNEVRWSLDLRWQDLSLSTGAEKIKPALKMWDKYDKNFKPKWDEWDPEAKETDKDNQFEIDDLTPIIAGPWMDYWELVHTNKHTDVWFSGMQTQKWQKTS